MPGGPPASRFPRGLLSLEIPKGTEIVRVHWQNNGSVFWSLTAWPTARVKTTGKFATPCLTG